MHELSVGWLNPLDDGTSHARRVSRAQGLRDGRLRRQHDVLRERHGSRPRVHSLRRFHLPGIHRTQDRPSWPIAFWRRSASCCRSSRNGRRWPGCARTCSSSGSRLSSIARERRPSTASFLNGCRDGTQPERPFFAFLNYSDAHTPYELPAGRIHRFGVAQPDERQRELIKRWGDLDKVRLAPQGLAVRRRCLRRLHRRPRRTDRQVDRQARVGEECSTEPG